MDKVSNRPVSFYCTECFKTLKLEEHIYKKAYEGHTHCLSCWPSEVPAKILTEEDWKERCRLLVLENDELMAENVKLRNLVSLANNLIPSENITWTNNLKTLLEELNHD